MRFFESPGSFYLVAFIMMFILIIGLMLSIVIRQWQRNRHSPRITIRAAVAAKRTRETRHLNQGGAVPHVERNRTFYVTFQTEYGDRFEFFVRKREYYRLKQGDCGVLTFQGARYLGFEREPSSPQAGGSK